VHAPPVGTIARAALLAVALAVAAGCGRSGPTDPSGSTVPAERTVAQVPQPGGDCRFTRGVTTCVATTIHVESTTHAEVSGCLAFDGTGFVPGRRTRTFQDEIRVTETTTTRRHGRQGAVFATSTTTRTEPLVSTLVADDCVAL
jgi:hypothetical protein